jgi:hypothetical protein
MVKTILLVLAYWGVLSLIAGLLVGRFLHHEDRDK